MKTRYWMGMLLAVALTGRGQTVPYSFNYQGVLRGGSGEPLGAVQKTVEFRLYNQAVNGPTLWGRSYAVLLDTNGLFNVELTDANGSILVENAKLQTVIAGNPTLYLGLTVSGSAEIAPRQQLLSVPYAMKAGDVSQTLGGLTVNGTLTVTNSVKVNAPGAIEGYGTIPIGGIIMWHGTPADIPQGWAVCDGQSGTPDLRSRFVLGAGDKYAPAATGGVDKVTLTTNQIPAHVHGFQDGYYIEKESDGHTYTNSVGGGGVYDTTKTNLRGSGDSDDDNRYIFWRQMNTASVGASQAHENMPPFYALCFIMRVK